MEERYAFRKSQLLEECQVAPEIFEQIMPRLETFLRPFVSIFQGQAADKHAKTYVCGLISNVERKNIESIAYRFGQSRLPLQGFMGGTRGTMRPCERSCGAKSRGTWAKAMGCWCSILPGFPNLVGSRWGLHDSGVVAWEKSIIAKWPSTWAMSRDRGTPWSIHGCTCRKHGPRIRHAWTK